MKKKKLPIIIGFLILIIDFIMSRIFVGYTINTLGIAVIIFGIYKLKSNKKITRILSGVLIAFGLIFIGLNLTSQTYYKTTINKKEVKIEIPRFTMKKGKSFKVLFKSANKKMNRYLYTLEQGTCNSKTYYDKKQDITIIGYELDEENKMNLKIEQGNHCKNQEQKIKKGAYKNFIEISELKRTYNVDQAIKDGYYVIKNNTKYNEQTLTNFLENKQSFIRIVQSNELNEPTIIDITYKNKEYILDYDNSRNSLQIEKQKLHKTYKEIKLENNHLYLMGNSGTKDLGYVG